MSPFEEEFRAFAQAEAREPLPRDPVLFYGSSSIRLWETLKDDFAGLPVVNRAFGGSTLRECVMEMEHLVLPMQPRAIILYAGDNDLDQGASPESLRMCVEQFMGTIDHRLGQVPVVFISIKPSPSRFWNIANIQRANELIQDALVKFQQAHYLDLFPLMLRPDGSPRHDIFTEDALHMNSAGYRLWTEQLRARLAELKILA